MVVELRTLAHRNINNFSLPEKYDPLCGSELARESGDPAWRSAVLLQDPKLYSYTILFVHSFEMLDNRVRINKMPF